MKLIEAMKRVKLNEEKIAELQSRIASASAHLSIENPVYPDQSGKVKEWVQSCTDLTQECVRLLLAIQRTNLTTSVTIELGEKQVTKTIAEWVWRRRKYAAVDMATWQKLTDRGLKEGITGTPGGGQITLSITRYYDPYQRDGKITLYREEPSRIDMALEIVNATTDLLEA